MNPHDDPLQHSLSALKGRISVSNVFLIFMNSGGDRFKTAAASGLSVEEVDSLSRSEQWAEKLQDRRKMAGDSKRTTEDINQELARLRASAQAERLMTEIDGILKYLETLGQEEKLKYLFETDRTGKTSPTAKFFLDLAKAVETCSQCVYRGHRDQLPMRTEAPDAEVVGKQIGAGVADGMARFVAGLRKNAVLDLPPTGTPR